ncbi:MAG TPA: hypothetical protein VHY08_27780 [Bacillota bacterium]|nr:hypothetical protein [Bacillota bacterium]
MTILWGIIIFLVSITLGITWQLLVKLSPWINLGISLGLLLILAPSWSLGLVLGIWIGCAFFTYNPVQERKAEPVMRIRWYRLFFLACFTFTGFLMTLILLWKFKVFRDYTLAEREIWAWIFLVVVEVCLYKVIVKISPGLKRIPLGYGIAVLNYLMILYWIINLGWTVLILTFLSLWLLNPLLLGWLDYTGESETGGPYWRS